MKIDSVSLQKKLTEAARRVVSEEDAVYFSQEVIECHMRKAPRTLPLKDAIGDLAACLKYREREIEYTIDLPAYVSINFNGHGPLPYLRKIHDDIEGRAAKNGIAMFAFTNSQSMHTLQTWVQGLARRGLVAIAVCNGGPCAVVPFNGTKGLFGTNPLAYGLPGVDGEIHCVDMATSEIPYFDIMDAHKNKAPLRERSAVNAAGEYTRNAAEALDFSASETDPVSNIVPMGGGYKGYCLIYLLEILTSGLINMPSSPEMSSDFIPEEHGSILIAFHPAALKTQNPLAKSIGAINKAVKSQDARAGEVIRLPGEENSQRLAAALTGDLEVDETLIQKLDHLLTF